MAVQFVVVNIHGVLWKVRNMPLYATCMLSCFYNRSGQSPAFRFCSFEISLVKVSHLSMCIYIHHWPILHLVLIYKISRKSPMTSCMKTIVLRSWVVLWMVVNKSKSMIQLISENAKANTSLAIRDASLNADDMASQSVRLKEEQLRKEEEKVTLISLPTQEMQI